jgi:hypothetical protein
MTRDGSIVGTLAYMSPEQCRGQDVDGRTDQYSLAIVLYELLTGKVPFEASTDYELMQAHINQTPEWPSRRAPGIAPHAEKAIMKALSKKAADRFPTMTAFKDALGSASSFRPEAAGIGHRATRLANISAISSSFPAISSAMTTVTESVNRLPVPPAVKGMVAGGGLALILAGGLLYLLSPRQPVQSNVVVTKVSNDSAPVQVIPQSQNNPYFIDQRRPAAQPPQGQTAQPASRPGSSGRGPFEVAAEQNPGPAAGNQPPGTPRRAPADPVASDQSPQRVASANPTQSVKPKPTDKEAIAAFEAKNYTSARELAEGCAKDDNPNCQFIMGKLLETGLAGNKDPAAAADWYRRAAEAGLATARYSLGALYYNGDGVQRDPRAAAEWFTKAAYQKHAGAQFTLATQYEKGEGVPKSTTEARRWYTEVVEKAADKQLVADAQEALDRLGSTNTSTSSGRRRR